MSAPQGWPAGLLTVLIALCAATASAPAKSDTVIVGSKTFTESYLLGELAARLIEKEALQVERKLGLGGTLVANEALRAGAVDLYPEYTGTLEQTLFNGERMPPQALEAALAERSMTIAVRLGFNNSYALAVAGPVARERQLRNISDLAAHPDLPAAFSHEFLERDDGWRALRAAYGLDQQAVGIEHALAYDALEAGRAAITEAYTTDGELLGRDIVLLEDDRAFFPGYAAVLLARDDLPGAALSALQPLRQRIDADTMRRLNWRVAVAGESVSAAASEFLYREDLIDSPDSVRESRSERIARHTLTHLRLTAAALLLACLVAIPMALLLSRFARLARGFVYLTGLLQTIPALALLALLVPLVGLGERPAIIALFLYSLLPIVRNTLSGLFSVDPLLKQVATGMGMTTLQQLRHVELPLAAPTILAGVKTAAIVSIGTATLAAFVGAGGLGEPIITGLTLNNHALILEGALPAAALAIAVEFLFELLERSVVPAHLRPR